MRITRVTTGDGDGGDTGLGGGQKVAKDSLRIESLGGIDELNALIGLALAGELAEDVAEELGLVQNDLFDLGADLAVLETDKAAEGACRIEGAQVDRLGNKIDTLQRELGPLEEFILPGGAATRRAIDRHPGETRSFSRTPPRDPRNGSAAGRA